VTLAQASVPRWAGGMIRYFAQTPPPVATPDGVRACGTRSVTVHEIPDEAMSALVRRAAQSGRSPQDYLRERLLEIAAEVSGRRSCASTTATRPSPGAS
jgi:hypothetical protein